jgi:hypothetical protein
MNTEILKQLNSIAINKSIPFCYSCYHEAPSGVCNHCGSDDLMRLLPGHGCEYGTEFIIEALLDDEVPSIDLEAEFEEFMRECYPEATQVAWMTLDTVSICKEMDPVSWDLAQSEWIDQQNSDGDIFTLNNGSTYFRVTDIETFIEKNSAPQ